MTATEAARQDVIRPESLKSLPKRTYRFRMLGMGLAALPLSAVLHEINGHWAAWTWMVFICFVWPQLAFLVALRSRDPLRAELRNFMLDSVFAGSCAPLMHFNLLPSVVLVTVVLADKINTGIRGLWLRSLPGMLAAIVVVGLLTGFALAPRTSMIVLVASLPILIIHTLAVSQSSYQLVRKVQRQNLQLEALSRVDALTGLDSRGHWQDQAETLLMQHQANGQPAVLLLLDVDHFKDVNDRHGHAVGDDVLRAIANRIALDIRPGSHAGRLGGDEFVLALPQAMPEAEALAERIRVAVEALRFEQLPALRCSVSIGLAPAPAAGLRLREWLEASDRALYRAKRAGRNRTMGRDAVTAFPDND